jgi:hypothetical protein
MPRVQASLPSTLWAMLALAVAGACVIGLINTFGNEPKLEEQARAAACLPDATPPATPAPSTTATAAARPVKPAPAAKAAAPAACGLQLTHFEANPMGRTFAFEHGATPVHVQCTRQWVLYGAYECRKVP